MLRSMQTQIRGIGLSGQMHGLTPLDKDGNVIRRAILWNDGRTAAECDEYVSRAGGEQRVRELVYNVPSPSYTAPKILWMRNHEPDNFARLAHVLIPKDYIRFRLSGEYATDMSDGTSTGLQDPKRRAWSDEMLRLLDIDKAIMPRLGEGHEVTAHVSASAARETGLVKGTPIVSGAGDQPASAVGAGVVTEGIVSVTIGTSGVVFASTDTMPTPGTQGVSPLIEVFCHAVPNTWHYMGVMLSAGGSLRWFRDNVAYGNSSLVTRDSSVMSHESRVTYPSNPNGSIADIAGVCNARGNVLGLMPHPENHIYAWQHPRWTRGERGSLGLALFENAMRVF